MLDSTLFNKKIWLYRSVLFTHSSKTRWLTVPPMAIAYMKDFQLDLVLMEVIAATRMVTTGPGPSSELTWFLMGRRDRVPSLIYQRGKAIFNLNTNGVSLAWIHSSIIQVQLAGTVYPWNSLRVFFTFDDFVIFLILVRPDLGLRVTISNIAVGNQLKPWQWAYL